ncbi:MAG: radical SAM protein [Syntrophobacteraceae bacterium]
MSFLFGPVPSRRLGRSLGIDVIPPKTCSLDCIYCESGATTHLSLKRQYFAEPAEVLREVEEFFGRFPRGADALTFSSAGEPTLYSGIGELIRLLKTKYPDIPLVVLTNGSLLWDSDVRKDLLQADRVVPSLDAVSPGAFNAINRPHPALRIDAILEGLHAFRQEYGGRLHIEVMLVSGVNDNPDELSALADAIALIEPDAIELNTVVRPPALPGTRGLTEVEMKRAASFFPAGLTTIIGCFRASELETDREDLPNRILTTIERRPCTIPELAASLGISEHLLKAESLRLRSQGRLVMALFEGKAFLCPPQRKQGEPSGSL